MTSLLRSFSSSDVNKLCFRAKIVISSQLGLTHNERCLIYNLRASCGPQTDQM